MLEEPEKLVGGLRIILSMFENATGLICLEDNKPAAAAVLTELIKNDKKILQALQKKFQYGH